MIHYVWSYVKIAIDFIEPTCIDSLRHMSTAKFEQEAQLLRRNYETDYVS